QDASKQGVPVVVSCWLRPKTGNIFERRPNIFVDAELPLPDENGVCQREACARMGNINMPVDERRLPLLAATEKPDVCSQSLALAAAAAYEDAIDRKPRTRDKQIIRSAVRDGHFVFSSFIPQSDFQTIEAEALAGGQPKAVAHCRGRILIIGGAWHTDMGHGEFVDTYDTPVGPMLGMYV